jgi:two-component system, OmpR family, manganese sensing sensor histidine kinase
MALTKPKGLPNTKEETALLGSRTFPALTRQSAQNLRRRLLLAYLAAMAAIVGTSAAAVYIFATRSVDQLLNHELLILAQAAAPSLEAIKTKGFPDVRQNLPWHHFFEREQGLEWYNADGKLLAQEGTTFPNLPLAKTFSDSRFHQGGSVIQQQGKIRALTLSVYSGDSEHKELELEGYIRASESTTEVEQVLSRFRVGLALGGLAGLTLSGIVGLCLAQLAVEPIKKSFQRLKQFTADASHELRTPLTAINTTIEVIQSHPEAISPWEAKKLDIISSATIQLTHLVEDLLFLARTDAAEVTDELEGSPIPLDEVLEDVVERFELQAQGKSITFKSNLQTSITVKGDPHQLLRLFSNLIGNALKYTKPGGTVSVSLDKRGRFAVVCVVDTGIGIASEYLPYIFQRFWRVDKVRSQQKEGVGLGLAIAQAIVQRHHGKIKVTSKLGAGSCFQVHLPLAQ